MFSLEVWKFEFQLRKEWMGKARPWAQNPREKAEGEEFPAWQASSVMAWPMKGELPPAVGPPKECVGKYINI